MKFATMTRRVGILLLATLLAAAPVAADDLVDRALQEQVQLKEAIQRALRAFVFVGARGSAVLISPDGYILTNDHVAGSAPEWRVRLHDGTPFTAKLVGTDPYGDIALLKIESAEPLPYIELGDSDAAKVGETVIAVGNPFGMSNTDERPTVTVGVISALNRPQIEKGLPDTVQTDAPINPGNSGGPLISMAGKLIGINGQIATRYETRSNTGIGFAISVNQIKRFLPVLKAAEGGMVRHGWLAGLAFKGHYNPQLVGRNLGVLDILRFRDPIKRELCKVGAPVAEAGQTAAAAGLQPGDVITAVDGWVVDCPLHALARILTYPAAASITLQIKRGEAQQDIKVTLDQFLISGEVELGVEFITSGGLQLEVEAVSEGSFAAKSGMQVGDRLLSISGIPLSVQRAEQLGFLMNQLQQNLIPSFRRTGANVALSVMRGEEELLLQLDIPRGPDELGFKLRVPAAPGEVRELQIRDLHQGGPAQRAGLRKGDVFTHIHGRDGSKRELKTRNDLEQVLRFFQPGQPIKFTIEREGQAVEIEILAGLKREMP